MSVLLLARHGETNWTREKRWQGHADPPLNERGREQARVLAENLAGVHLDAIYSSDLRRASETAAIVAAERGLDVRLDPALRENDFGDWTGLTRDEVERRFPEGSRLRKSGRQGWNGGESYEDMAARIGRAIQAIAALHPAEQVLVITHNGPIRAVHAHVFGLAYVQYRQTAKSIKKGSLSAVSLENGVWRSVSSLPGLPADALFVAEAPATEGLARFATIPDRLLDLSDPAAVGAALTRSVPELGSGERELRECRVERVRLKRGSLTVLYRLTLGSRVPGEEDVVELVGEILAPGASEPEPGPTGAPFGADGWRCYLPELRLELGLQPPEPALPALPTLTNPRKAGDLLEQAIRSCSPAYSDLRIQAARPHVVRAKGSRCTILYDLEFPPEDGGRGWPSPVIAKTYRGDKGANAYAGMRALWSSALGRNEVVSVAEPLAFAPELNVLVQGPVHGEATLKSLIRSAFGAGTPEALAELSAYVDKTAVGLAELHTSGVEHGRSVTWADKLSDVRELSDGLTALAPELAGAAEPLLALVTEQEAEHPPDLLVPSHGSFRPNQVLLNAGEVGFIDFDRFGQAEPGVDVASFRAACRDAGRLDPDESGLLPNEGARRERLRLLDELCDRFLARYASLAPVSRERVALWEALDLFTIVLHCWTKMEAGLPARLELLRHHLGASEPAS